MSDTKDSQDSFVVENGLTLGMLVLALVVIFVVGLPQVFPADEAQPDVPVELPQKIGDLELAEMPAAQQSQLDSVEESSTEVTGAPVAAGTYQNADGSEVYMVQALRASDDVVLSPLPAQEYRNVGDAQCLTVQQGMANCQLSEGALTVTVTAASIEDAADFATRVYDELKLV